MQWLLNMRTAGKIMLGVGTMALVLWLSLLYAFATIQTMQKSMQRINDIHLNNVANVEGMRAAVNLVQDKMFKVLLVPDNTQLVTEERAKVEALRAEIKQDLDALKAGNQGDPNLVRKVTDIEVRFNEYATNLTNETWPAFDAGNLDLALTLMIGIQTTRIEDLRSMLATFAEAEENSAEAAVIAAEEQAGYALIIFAIAGAVSIALTVAVVLLLNRTVAEPLRHVTRLAERVANYDLTVELEDRGRKDEVGSLISTTSSMLNNLRNITRSINEGVNVLVSSSTEITASTSQTAASITQTATAITETTTTVEEVKQTAQLTSQKAKTVSESAQRANEFAKTGGRAVEEMGEGMRGIREHFRGIVENIMQLSTQSHGIGSIIATVDDLAEQSNVLAVNAAIEAAKAGEHGRSFSVVAQEVRNLAEQSKEATRQVRQLLNEIQRGVSTAGMATEQGSKAVDGGIRQAEEASKQIAQLLASIAEAAQAAIQIAASSQQQLVGMDQVAMAMENIRSASEQNVNATRQVEESARVLTQLGHRLKVLVDQYKVSTAAG